MNLRTWFNSLEILKQNCLFDFLDQDWVTGFVSTCGSQQMFTAKQNTIAYKMPCVVYLFFTRYLNLRPMIQVQLRMKIPKTVYS